MAKKNERKQARTFFVELGKTCKEIHTIIDVSERTLGVWRKEGNWDDLRSAKVVSSTVRVDNLRKIINNFSERRIALDDELRQAEADGDADKINDLLTKTANIDDGVSRWNKTLENVSKEGKIPVSTHVAVLEMIFNYMRVYDEKLYLKSVEFQEKYIDHLLNKNAH